MLKQRVDEESGDETYVIKDRVSNRYWLVGPIQFEVARIFAQTGKPYAALKQEVQDCFEDEVTDDDITSVYQDFHQLGLLQLVPEEVAQRQIPLKQYRAALRRFGVTMRRASPPLQAYLREVEAPNADMLALFNAHQALARKYPDDALVLRAGEAFFAADAQEVKRKQMAQMPPVVRLMRVQKPLIDPNEHFDRWLPRLRFIFTRWFFVLTLIVSAFGFAIYAARLPELANMMTVVASNIPLLVICAAIMLFVHECMHGLTCKYFGGEVRDMGVMLMMLTIPAAYADVSDAHLFESRKAKAWVTFAGTYSSFVVAALGTLIWSYTETDTILNHAGLMFAMSGFAVVFSNLNPLIPLDGYFLLCDLTGIENLRERAMPYARAYIAALINKKAPKPAGSPKERTIFLGFYVFATMYQISYVFVMLSLGWMTLVRGGNVATLMLFCLLVYVMYARPYGRKLWQLRKNQPHAFAMAMSAAMILLALAIFVPREAKVTIDAKVVPGVHRELSVGETATVRRLVAHAGEWVDKDALIIELGSEELEIETMRAKSELMQVESELQNLGKGPQEELVNAYEEQARSGRLEQMRRFAAQSRLEGELALGVATVSSLDAAMLGTAASATRAKERQINVDSLYNDPLRRLTIQRAGMKAEYLRRKLMELADRRDAMQIRAPIAGWVIYDQKDFSEGSAIAAGESFGIVAATFALSGVLPEAYMGLFERVTRCEAYVSHARVAVKDVAIWQPKKPDWEKKNHGAVAYAELTAAPTADKSRPPVFFGATGELIVHADKRTSSLWLWTKRSVTEGILDLWRMI